MPRRAKPADPPSTPDTTEEPLSPITVDVAEAMSLRQQELDEMASLFLCPFGPRFPHLPWKRIGPYAYAVEAPDHKIHVERGYRRKNATHGYWRWSYRVGPLTFGLDGYHGPLSAAMHAYKDFIAHVVSP